MKSFLKRYILAILIVAFAVVCNAAIPTSYYTAANGKKMAELKTALYNIVKKHTQLEYYASSVYFITTDWNPDGYIWDMYSNFKRPTWTGMNREHSLPKSWWSAAPETTVAYSDLHNLYPSDATANSAKSNYSLGEVTGTPEYANGVIKVGANGFPGYTGTVFEPADEYKGDFARDYMYVVTSYENYANNWRSTGTLSMLLGGTYPVFRPWAVNLLLKWHRNDPVSDKEINRNNAVYGFQNNRNPFIDHPELAEFIWGKYMGQSWVEEADLPVDEIALIIQPNPIDNKLIVTLNNPEEAIFYIRSLSGVTFKTGKFSAEGTVAVDDLRNGMYILVVYTGTKRKVSKFVVHHE